MGRRDARNIGMEYISAPYFAFLDADDWMEPDGYEKLIRMAIRYQCDIVQCSSISHLGKARPMFQKTVSEPVYYKIDNIEERRRFIRWWNSPGTSGVSIYRTEWIKENNIKFKRFEKYEDNYWGGILSYYINSYCAIPDYLFHYRRHESSNSLSRNDLKHFECLKVELELLKYYHEMELFTDYYQEIRKHFLEVFYINTLHIVICQFDYFPLEIIKEMQEVVKSIFPDFLEYCEDVGEFANPVLTVPFDFPQEIWEDYKRAYLDYLQGKGENKLVQFYTVIRRSLGM